MVRGMVDNVQLIQLSQISTLNQATCAGNRLLDEIRFCNRHTFAGRNKLFERKFTSAALYFNFIHVSFLKRVCTALMLFKNINRTIMNLTNSAVPALLEGTKYQSRKRTRNLVGTPQRQSVHASSPSSNFIDYGNGINF